MRPVGVADLPGRERPAGRRPARRRSTARPTRGRGARPRPRRRRCWPARRGAPGAARSPAGKTGVAGVQVVARPARTWSPGVDLGSQSTATASSPPSRRLSLHHHDRVGAVGHRRAGHDPDRPRPARAGTSAPCRRGCVPTTSSRTGAAAVAPAVSAARTAYPSIAVLRTAAPARWRRRPRRPRSPRASASAHCDTVGSGPAGAPRTKRARLVQRDQRHASASRPRCMQVRRGRPRTRGRGRRGRAPARRWPGGSRASCRCRSGRRRTRSRRPSGRRAGWRWRR